MPAQGLRPMGTLALPLEGSESGLTFVQKDLPCAAGWGRDWETQRWWRGPEPGHLVPEEEGFQGSWGPVHLSFCHGPEKPAGLTH